MGTIFWRNTLAISVWLSLALWVSPTLAQEFYKGKTIRLIVATTPGGGFDAYSRAIARHNSVYAFLKAIAEATVASRQNSSLAKKAIAKYSDIDDPKMIDDTYEQFAPY